MTTATATIEWSEAISRGLQWLGAIGVPGDAQIMRTGQTLVDALAWIEAQGFLPAVCRDEHPRELGWLLSTTTRLACVIRTHEFAYVDEVGRSDVARKLAHVLNCIREFHSILRQAEED